MRRPRRLLLALVLALGLGPAASRPANANGAPAVRVGDRPVDLHGDLAAQAAALAERLLDTPVQVDVLGRPVERSWRELGARVDVERLEGWLQQAADPSSPMREAAGARLPLRLPVEVDVRRFTFPPLS